MLFFIHIYSDLIIAFRIEKDIYYELIGFCYNEEKNKLEATRYYLKALEFNSLNFMQDTILLIFIWKKRIIKMLLLIY